MAAGVLRPPGDEAGQLGQEAGLAVRRDPPAAEVAVVAAGEDDAVLQPDGAGAARVRVS